MNSVCFRALEPEDAISIYKWMNDFTLMKDAVGMSRFVSSEECRQWVSKRMIHDPYNFCFAICINDESKKLIGYMSLNNVHYINSSAETGAILIGDKNYRDGISWIESILYIHYFAFEVLHLNRLYGSHLLTQKVSASITDLFFWKNEGIQRQAIYKNGKYQDLSHESILKDEYFIHKDKGEYTVNSIIKRLKILHNNKLD